MLMPWGKYRGREMAELPSSYLCWIIEEADSPSILLLGEARRILAQRFAAPAPRPPQSAIGLTKAAVAEILVRWFRKVALRWHPDRGRHGEGMAALNDAYDELKREFQV